MIVHFVFVTILINSIGPSDGESLVIPILLPMIVVVNLHMEASTVDCQGLRPESGCTHSKRESIEPLQRREYIHPPEEQRVEALIV